MTIVLALAVVLLHHPPASVQAPPDAGETAMLVGRVVAEDGSATPLRGAQVSLVSGASGEARAVSDEQGRFALPVPARGEWSIRVTKAGYAPAEFAGTSPVSEPVVRLMRGAVITGRVVDRRGDPVPRATVRVRPDVCPDPCEAPASGPSPAQGELTAETDDLGEYRLGSLPAGRYDVRLDRRTPVVMSFALGGDSEVSVWTIGGVAPAALTSTGRDAATEPGLVVQIRPGEETTVHLVADEDVRTDGVRRDGAAAVGRPGVSAASGAAAAAEPARTGGTVRGRIIAPTGRPAGGAMVRLASIAGAASRMAVANDDGRYEVVGVPAGDYRLTATLSGFAPVQYGQQRASQQGTTLAVRAGSVVDGIDVRLPPGGVITGRVVDAYGEPLEGIAVRVLERRFAGGRVVLAPVGGAPVRRTDDRGHYRIHGLLPGAYYVMAGAAGRGEPAAVGAIRFTPANTISGSGSVSPDGRVWSFVGASNPADAGAPSPSVFYPAGATAADAVPVRIEPRIDGYGIDIVFAPAPAARIRGLALDSTGAPVQGTATLLVSQRSGAPAPPPRSAPIGPDGTFEFLHVPPGDYVVHALSRRTATRVVRGAESISRLGESVYRIEGRQTEEEFGMQFATVSGAGDLAVMLRTSPGSRIRGRVAAGGDRSSVSRAGFVVGVVPADLDRAPAAMRPRGALDDDWRFELAGVVGPVRIELLQAPPGWYLKSAMAGGIDAAEYPVSFGAPGQPDETVDVVVARGGEISGRVVDERGDPAADYSVVVFPTDPTRWYERSRHVTLTRGNQDGGFTVTSLPPGDYWVAAVDRIAGDADSREWQSPAALSSLTAGARRVRVAEAQPVSTELTLIRAPW